MSASACERFSVSIPAPVVEVLTAIPIGEVDTGTETVDTKDSKTEGQALDNALVDVDTERETGKNESVSPICTSLKDGSGHESVTVQENSKEDELSMSTSACKRFTVSIPAPVVEVLTAIPIGEEDPAPETVNTNIKNNKTEDQALKNAIDDVDAEREDGKSKSAVGSVCTSVMDHSGQESVTVQNSSDNLIGCTQMLHEDSVSEKNDVAGDAANMNSIAQASRKGDVRGNQNGAKAKSIKEAAKEEKKEDKKKSKKKEDKSVEYILRALNSLQSPEEKLAALCKKYADMHEEHRVLQNSFKAQQRNLTVVVREKDQLQSEHTKAMIAKSKLESLCRELQKHNKIIKDESIKRAKEDDEKRKEISAQFNVTITEIQNQMSDNSEKNNRLRKENDNLAEQLRAFISQCQGRDEHVKKIQEHHDLEKKLAAAKLAQAEAILKEVEERGNKEKELMLYKLTEITKKAQITESQLGLYKSKYDEFNDLHTRSSETFQKYKTEMDKMTKRIKKLEKDGLQWKAKWESTSKALVEQYEARSKSEQETTVCVQKMKKLESLCRALQAELRGKKVADKEGDEEKEQKPSKVLRNDSTSSAVPADSPKISSSNQCSPDITEEISSTEVGISSAYEPSASTSSKSSTDSSSLSSPEPTEETVTEAAEASQNDLEQDGRENFPSTNCNNTSLADSNQDVVSTVVEPVTTESRTNYSQEKKEAEVSTPENTV